MCTSGILPQKGQGRTCLGSLAVPISYLSVPGTLMPLLRKILSMSVCLCMLFLLVFLLWSVKRGQSAAGVQYSCRLAGLGPLELTGAPTEIRTQDLADFIDNRGLTTILISLDYIIFSVSREGVLRTFVLLPCGIVSEPFPGSIAFALGDPLIGC